jgi:hypothetical protein
MEISEQLHTPEVLTRVKVPVTNWVGGYCAPQPLDGFGLFHFECRSTILTPINNSPLVARIVNIPPQRARHAQHRQGSSPSPCTVPLIRQWLLPSKCFPLSYISQPLIQRYTNQSSILALSWNNKQTKHYISCTQLAVVHVFLMQLAATDESNVCWD